MARVDIGRLKLRLTGVDAAQAHAIARVVAQSLASAPLEAGAATDIPAMRVSLPPPRGGPSSLASHIAGGIRRAVRRTREAT
jgi:hypothetical protein